MRSVWYVPLCRGIRELCVSFWLSTFYEQSSSEASSFKISNFSAGVKFSARGFFQPIRFKLSVQNSVPHHDWNKMMFLNPEAVIVPSTTEMIFRPPSLASHLASSV